MAGDCQGRELAFVLYIECVPHLEEADEAVSCLCLQWATAGSAEREHDVEKKSGDRSAVAASD